MNFNMRECGASFLEALNYFKMALLDISVKQKLVFVLKWNW